MPVVRIGAFVLAVVAVGSAVVGQTRGPTLRVEVNADRHPISPLIYGMDNPTLEVAREIRLPLNRWGGDATTRYNWQTDSSNAGDDWFFMAGGDELHPTPSGDGPDKLVDGLPWVRRA